ncbi:hypothetical protein [Pseudomonas sp. Leaf127]
MRPGGEPSRFVVMAAVAFWFLRDCTAVMLSTCSRRQ